MPTAPSFASYKKITDTPFYKNGKLYITVEHPNTHNHRDVRWYSDAEFAKTYGSKLVSTNEGFSGLKHARGFDKGPILAIRKNKAEDDEWLRRSDARYAVGIGWYFASTSTLPIDAPAHFKYLPLEWNEFRDGDNQHMKKPEQLSAILNQKIAKGEWVPRSNFHNN